VNLRKFLIRCILSLDNETMREKQASESRSTKSNSKGKSGGWRELSMNATNIKKAKCSICKGGHAMAMCRRFQELPSWKTGTKSQS